MWELKCLDIHRANEKMTDFVMSNERLTCLFEMLNKRLDLFCQDEMFTCVQSVKRSLL